MHMMALDQFLFGLGTLAYDELRRHTEWRHPSNSRVGVRAARQWVGPGDDTITLSGVLVPEFAGRRTSLDDLRAMADTGWAYALVSGIGQVFGAFVIVTLQETGTVFVAEGVARRTAFELTLGRVDDALATTGPWPGDDGWEWWM